MPPLPTRDQLADALIEALKKLPGRPPSEEEFEREVDQKCLELWELDRKQEENKEPSLSVIPRLFCKRDFTPNSIAEQTRREARIRLLKRQEMLLLEQSDLDLCHDLLLQNSIGPAGQERINYDGFCQVMIPRQRLLGGLCANLDTKTHCWCRWDLNWAINSSTISTQPRFCTFLGTAKGKFPYCPSIR
jgi:hypothetical protein